MISIILLISNICSQLSNPTNKTIKWMLDLYLKNKEVINYLSTLCRNNHLKMSKSTIYTDINDII